MLPFSEMCGFLCTFLARNRFDLDFFSNMLSEQMSSMPWNVTSDGCSLGKPIHRRPVLPGLAPPFCRAPPRLEPPMKFPGFRFHR